METPGSYSPVAHWAFDAGPPATKWLDLDQVRSALNERAEGLFRQFWGEPERPSAREWRLKGTTSKAMIMRGAKRGLWYNHKTGEGGTLLDFVAVEMSGLSSARDDFHRVLQDASRLCGADLDEPLDLAIIQAKAAARIAQQAIEEREETARRELIIEALKSRSEPIEGSPAAAYLRSRGISQVPRGWVYLPSVPDLPIKHARYAALVVFGEDDTGQVKGGQRILLTPNGAKAEVEVRKVGFGQVNGYPVRLNKGCNGPLIIAEGPETAAAIAQVVDHEVWAVFGVSGFAGVSVPVGREVILCPDQDAADSPAGKTFSKAVQALVEKGVAVRIATAPEPEGSKRDLNDTLMRQGAEAVRNAIKAAKIVKHCEAVDCDECISLPEISAEDARLILRDEVVAGLRRPGVTLIEATLGLGKTSATISALDDLLATSDAGAVVLAVPIHRLGRQMVKDIRAVVPKRRVVQMYGAEAQDPFNPDETVCKRLDEYREQASLMLDVEELCSVCAWKDKCLHQTSKSKCADVYIVSHQRLKSDGLPLKQWQHLLATVVDENPVNALVSVSGRGVPLSALIEAPTRISNKEGWQSFADADAEASLKRYRKKIKETIIANGEGYLRRHALEKWTIEEVDGARKLEWRRKINDPNHPEVSGNKSLPTINRLLKEFGRLLAKDESNELNARVEIRKGGQGLEILLNTLRPINEVWLQAPVLMLDATANVEIAALLAGQELAHHVEIRASENIAIKQAIDLSGAKSHFFARGRTTGNVARISNWIRVQTLTGGQTAVISNKRTIEALDLPDSVAKAHFNALRGLNNMQETDHLIIIGRTLPPEAAIARYVAALWGEPVNGGLVRDASIKRIEIGAFGEAQIVKRVGTSHSCPKGQAVLAMIRDNEVIQAIGRLRGANRKAPARVTLISDAVTGYAVEPAMLKSEIKLSNILWPMLSRGVAFLSAAQAAKAYPDLYASQQAAQKVFGAANDWTTFPIKSLYGKGCAVAKIRTPRSRITTTALIAPWITDVHEEIEKHLPGALVLNVEWPPNARATENAAQFNNEAQHAEELESAAANRMRKLADPDGVSRTAEAIEAVWDWAEALAKKLQHKDAEDSNV